MTCPFIRTLESFSMRLGGEGAPAKKILLREGRYWFFSKHHLAIFLPITGEANAEEI